jgi:hypothetical protein
MRAKKGVRGKLNYRGTGLGAAAKGVLAAGHRHEAHDPFRPVPELVAFRLA